MVRPGLRPGTVTAALVGAVVGLLLVWTLEVTGHRWWSVLLMIAAAVGPAVIKSIYKSKQQRPASLLRWTRYGAPIWVRVGATLPLVVATLAILRFFDLNPRDHGYALLLPSIIVIAILFGSAPALFAIVLSTIIADYLYARPADRFAITEWEDAAGLAIFAFAGAQIALAVSDFLLSYDEV
jgi:K+-sensing histidine kinase KdpD